jgi:hypothetical protein
LWTWWKWQCLTWWMFSTRLLWTPAQGDATALQREDMKGSTVKYSCLKNLLMDYRIFGTEASDCECRACGSCGREYLVHQGISPSDTMANWRSTRHHGIFGAKRVVKSMRLQPLKRIPAKSSLPWEKVIGEERHSHWALDPWDG